MRKFRPSSLTVLVSLLALCSASCSTRDSTATDPLDPPPVVPPTIARVEITIDSISLRPGETIAFGATGIQSTGDTVPVAVSWSATGGSIALDGQYSAGQAAGRFIVVAALDGSSLADTAVVIISAAPVTLAGVQMTPVAINVAPGGTQQFSAVGLLSNGGTASIRVNWSATGGTISSAGLFTAGRVAGSYQAIATREGDILADTASVTVSAPPAGVSLTRIEVTPGTVSLNQGGAQQFAAIGRLSNSGGTSVNVSWSASGGTISSSGLYTAGTAPGTYRVIAVRVGDTLADTSVVTVSAPAATLSGIEISPTSVSMSPAGTQQFSARGRMSDNTTTSISATWSATGGTISSGGLYTAGSGAGNFRVIATRAGDNSKADTSAVNIAAPTTTLTDIEISPGTATLATGKTIQFSALGRLSDNSTTSVSVMWIATGGAVSTNGLYTAGPATGTFHVIATRVGDNSKADTSAVTITVSGGATLTSVAASPATASVGVGKTQQFSAAGKLSDGSTGSVSVTWSATGGTISTGGMYTAGSTAGTYRVIAVQQGGTKADTSAVTVTSAVTAPSPSGTAADPTQLPVASGQLKNVAAYTALNVPGMAAGSSYRDPVTGVRVWKVTSASVPSANSGEYHFYSEGPAQISREWGPGQSTLYLYTGWLVDFTRGSGLSNWRRAPSGTNLLSFSKNPATPRIAYVAIGAQLRRYDTGTNSFVDTGRFPAAFNIDTWLQQDNNDGWFVALGATAGTVIAWNSQTGQSYSRSFSGLDEPYLERDGHYVLVNASSPQIWDLSANTLSAFTPPGRSVVVHVPALRSFFILGDPTTGAGITPQWRVDPSPARANVQISTLNGYAPDEHASGMWVQTDAELGNDLTKQWWLRTTYNWSYAATGTGVNEGIAFLRADGSAFQLLLHHYSVMPTNGADNYWSEPRGTLSVDGKLVMFESNMNNTSRTDVFLAEVPVQ